MNDNHEKLAQFVCSGPGWSITPARYAAGKLVLRCGGLSIAGFKTNAARLADALGGRYTNRDKGYQMSPLRSLQWRALYERGWDMVGILWLGTHRKTVRFEHAEHGTGYTLQAAMALAVVQPPPVTPPQSSASRSSPATACHSASPA